MRSGRVDNSQRGGRHGTVRLSVPTNHTQLVHHTSTQYNDGITHKLLVSRLAHIITAKPTRIKQATLVYQWCIEMRALSTTIKPNCVVEIGKSYNPEPSSTDVHVCVHVRS